MTHISASLLPHFVTADLATLPAAEEEMKTGRVSPGEAEVLGWDTGRGCLFKTWFKQVNYLSFKYPLAGPKTSLEKRNLDGL